MYNLSFQRLLNVVKAMRNGVPKLAPFEIVMKSSIRSFWTPCLCNALPHSPHSYRVID